MTPRDLFGLAVRLGGLYMLWTSANMLFGLILGPMPFLFWVTVWQVFFFFAGLWMLRGAPQLVDYAYPPGQDAHPGIPGNPGIQGPSAD